MFHPERPKIASFRTEYAKRVDFCDAFERNIKPFYLLAFLLTTNNKEAEQCLASTIEESCEENVIFKAWMGSWIKRCLIKKAIHIVFSGLARSDEQRNLWSKEPGELRVSNVVNAVTKLKALERFVFVMSVLEGYSSRECSMLLDCSMESIVQLQVRAFCGLATSSPFLTGDLAGSSERQKSA